MIAHVFFLRSKKRILHTYSPIFLMYSLSPPPPQTRSPSSRTKWFQNKVWFHFTTTNVLQFCRLTWEDSFHQGLSRMHLSLKCSSAASDACLTRNLYCTAAAHTLPARNHWPVREGSEVMNACFKQTDQQLQRHRGMNEQTAFSNQHKQLGSFRLLIDAKIS